MKEERNANDVYDFDETSKYPVQPIQVDLNFEKFKRVISDNLENRREEEKQ